MEPKVIRMEKVGRVFHTDDMDTHALVDIDLEVETGEFVSIGGPSGCGKSTLLSIMGLLDRPSSGEFYFAGERIGNLASEEQTRIRNREIGFVFQNYNLLNDLNVFENVELPLEYRGIRRVERKRRVTEALERVKMAHRSRFHPSQLSGGQQQRVAVARALAGEPSILLADEPTGNLDSANGERVMDLLRDLYEEGATICVVTHDERYQAYAARTIQLFDGRIVE